MLTPMFDAECGPIRTYLFVGVYKVFTLKNMHVLAKTVVTTQSACLVKGLTWDGQ